MLQILQKRNIYFAFSALLVGASVVVLVIFGLKPSIDFTNGTLIEVRFSENRPAPDQMRELLAANTYSNAVVQPTNEDAYILKLPFISEDQHQELLTKFRENFETDTNKVLEERVETIGPSVSKQLRQKALSAGIAVVLAIVAYVAYAFRKITRPVASWKYGITAIIALFHDVLITMGVFALLGHFKGVEVDIPFVVALLTILGYSVNDTIVVFDRIREELLAHPNDTFEDVVNRGVNATLIRSFNTSFTTLLVLFALYLFGGASIHYFALALIVGIGFGTYSSIFLASPLLVVWQKFTGK